MPMGPPNPGTIKAGDTDPLVMVIEDANGPVNLTGATVVFHMKPAKTGIGHAAIASACVVDQFLDSNGKIKLKGQVRYVWGAGETDLPGVYNIECKVTWSNGKTRTFPNDRFVSFEVEPNAT